jgi:hypothetical protein
MRDCVFLVADKNMQATFEGFLTREKFCRSLGCGDFAFDADEDLRVAAGDNDPGLYTRGHELLRPFRATHRHAIVVLDAEWEGAPKATIIAQNMSQNIQATGWEKPNFRVIVIDPELENWIWQRSEHVAQGLGFESNADMAEDGDFQKNWPQGQDKPDAPKELLETILRKKRIPRSSSLYKRITSCVSARACRDSAFLELKKTLKVWFPPSKGAKEVRS